MQSDDEYTEKLQQMKMQIRDVEEEDKTRITRKTVNKSDARNKKNKRNSHENGLMMNANKCTKTMKVTAPRPPERCHFHDHAVFKEQAEASVLTRDMTSADLRCDLFAACGISIPPGSPRARSLREYFTLLQRARGTDSWNIIPPPLGIATAPVHTPTPPNTKIFHIPERSQTAMFKTTTCPSPLLPLLFPTLPSPYPPLPPPFYPLTCPLSLSLSPYPISHTPPLHLPAPPSLSFSLPLPLPHIPYSSLISPLLPSYLPLSPLLPTTPYSTPLLSPLLFPYYLPPLPLHPLPYPIFPYSSLPPLLPHTTSPSPSLSHTPPYPTPPLPHLPYYPSPSPSITHSPVSSPPPPFSFSPEETLIPGAGRIKDPRRDMTRWTQMSPEQNKPKYSVSTVGAGGTNGRGVMGGRGGGWEGKKAKKRADVGRIAGQIAFRGTASDTAWGNNRRRGMESNKGK
ncbi:hypothetical protein C7M84_014406 [Penaeus vannamei]|uniref:Uncharacterized protein n=1 Tax=Penaeus vannamei TaxID=6689 RepID=A0A3R7PIB9_PENVA|nr:hypothetical protein C7M84_014406 [Penaeus vannamei]